MTDKTSDTVRPPAGDIDLAVERLDSASMALLNQADMSADSDELLQSMIDILENHGHALLRAAEALRIGRLRRHAREARPVYRR